MSILTLLSTEFPEQSATIVGSDAADNDMGTEMIGGLFGSNESFDDIPDVITSDPVRRLSEGQ